MAVLHGLFSVAIKRTMPLVELFCAPCLFYWLGVYNVTSDHTSHVQAVQ